VLNFIAIDLQLYKIFKITRVSFFGTHCKCLEVLCFVLCTTLRVYFRSTEEIFALFISMAFAFDAFKDVVCGKTVFRCLRVS